jgi:kynureninase
MRTQKTLEDCRQARCARPVARTCVINSTCPTGVIYLDGNSQGVLPRATAARVAKVVTQEWGQGLIRSWNSACWFDAPRRAGDKIARLVGADPSEVVATDSTSINLFKVLSAALNMAREDAPQRKTLVSERSNFPTDLYIAEALCRERGCTLKLVEPEEIAASLTPTSPC